MSAKNYPKTIGGCVDALYKMRQRRLDAAKVVEALKKEEDELEDHIINTFGKSDINGVKGKMASASIKTLVTVSVTDWDKYLGYVVKKKAWDLLRKQPASTAVKERWEAGVEVPGVEPFNKISLSLTKVN